MLDWLMNFSTGLVGWTMFLLTVLGAVLGLWLVLEVVKLIRSVNEDNGKWRLHAGRAVLKSFLFAIYLFATLSAFGPGTPPQELPSDIGVMEYVDKAPDMKTPAEIQTEAEAKVDPFLKKQDEGFKAEQEEADAYLENLRKKHQNQ